jgi:uncharacterized damage-inducible protein DinB
VDNIKLVQKLLNDHYDGVPWIDITIMGTLRSITAKQAAAKIGELNSIWQIVNHMIACREALIARVKDKPVAYPDGNYISEIKNTTPKAWKDTLKKFEKSQKNIISFLNRSNDPLLEKISPTSEYSYYELVLAILQHDTYHIGQIVLIKKMLDSSDPDM